MILQLSFCWALHYHLLHDPFSWWTGRLLASSMFNSIRMEMRNVYKCKNVKQRTCLMSSWSLCTLFFFFPKYFTSKNICWWCVREHTWFLTILFHLVKLLCCNCGLSLNWKKKKKTWPGGFMRVGVCRLSMTNSWSILWRCPSLSIAYSRNWRMTMLLT